MDETDDQVDEAEAPLSQLPVCCQQDAQLPGMFRVKRAKGKVFSSGGFGVAITLPRKSAAESNGEGNNDTQGKTEVEKGSQSKQDQSTESSSSDKNSKTVGSEPAQVGGENLSLNETHEYLFLEEVVFLFEKGLLECEKGFVEEQDSGHEDRNTYQASELYSLLKTMQVPMASYFVFAHLRQQTFRVIRYSSDRLSLLRQLNNDSDRNPRQKRELHLELRRDVQLAPPPVVIDGASDEVPQFAFCVYNPDCNFSRSNPGLPDFLVAVTVFGQSALDYKSLQSLISQAQGIPIKLATVADSGTVVMFGITDVGVPPLASPAT